MRMRTLCAAATAVLLAAAAGLVSGQPAQAAARPWLAAAATPEERADALLAQMTPAEKITMMHGGAQCAWGACVDANTRLGIPALKLQDGPAGVADGAGGITGNGTIALRAHRQQPVRHGGGRRLADRRRHGGRAAGDISTDPQRRRQRQPAVRSQQRLCVRGKTRAPQH
jgi:hypothetical protein